MSYKVAIETAVHAAIRELRLMADPKYAFLRDDKAQEEAFVNEILKRALEHELSTRSIFNLVRRLADGWTEELNLDGANLEGAMSELTVVEMNDRIELWSREERRIHIRASLAGWVRTQGGPDGGAWVTPLGGLAVIVSARREQDGKPWLHVSCSQPDGVPSWEDLVQVKQTFIGDKLKAIQVFPPTSEYVNIHANVLHLWACLDDDGIPDFTRGHKVL